MATAQQAPDAYTRQLDILHRLLDERIGQHALFFEIDMDALPDGSPEIVGHVLDARGQPYYFGMGWDDAAGAPTLRALKPGVPEPHWSTSREYLDARRDLGLSVPEAATSAQSIPNR